MHDLNSLVEDSAEKRSLEATIELCRYWSYYDIENIYELNKNV